MRKVALNISKDVKKFWLKIEKLVTTLQDNPSDVKFSWSSCAFERKYSLTLFFQVLYKHQLELDEKKKKTLDKQLEFLLGQTERCSFFSHCV